MKKIKLYRLYWIMVTVLCACGVNGGSLCTKIAMELGLSEFDTLCDLDFCTCSNPSGRVKCTCPGQDPDEEIVIRSEGPCSVSADTISLTVENCTKVTVIKEAAEGVKDLRNLDLINIKTVDIQGRIFPPDGTIRNVHFVNSTIPDVPSFTFSGNVNSITFDNCNVGTIRAFAFSSIHGADRILFRDTNVTNVEAQSFKKFTVNKFLIVGSRFNVLPGRFVVDLVVESIFKIDATYIDVIGTSAFKIHSPKKVLVVNSIINKLHGDAFKIVTKGEVVMESNVLNSIDNEAFRGVSVDKYVILQSGKQKFKFQNQTITNLEDKALHINGSCFEVQIEKLLMNEPCTCDGLTLWKEIITEGEKLPESTETDLEPIWCRTSGGKTDKLEYVPGRHFYKDYCTKLTTGIYFFVIIITGTAAAIVITATIAVCLLRRRKKWRPVPSSRADAPQKNQKKVRKKRKEKKIQGVEGKSQTTKAIIVPDGRTYKETEFHIIVEKAEPLNEECIPYTIVRDRSHSQIH